MFVASYAGKTTKVMIPEIQNQAILECARKFFKDGNLKKAKNYYEYLLSKKHDSLQAHDALLDLSRIAYSQGCFEEAFKYCKNAIVEAPNFTEAYSVLAYLYKKQGNLKASQRAILRYLEINEYLPKQSYSINDLDVKLNKYINYKGGFFIEAGANDGLNQSNTLFFERHLRWKGILVEPIPRLSNLCKVNRACCAVESTALVPFEYQQKSIEIYDCNLMSIVKGGKKIESDLKKHLEFGGDVQKITPTKIQVPAMTLTSILDKYKPPKIDLLSLDVEGFELSVLQGLDFERYAPTYILIEANYRDEIENFLSAIGYRQLECFSLCDILYKLY